ncbi:short-chain dehydrogenase [Pyrrhoderma noxium]|uniref:Short-chain dehydrogenase n=1 Tax=Pyrrhoderma noxium TaxID=2282107 RepID=A0A286UX54_9AGAM|nr:short-chain dehydrogenase [Pyrrhoderma noxium]
MATLKGKRIVVVGGSSGIGFAVARESLKLNAELVVVASSSATKVENAVSKLEKEIENLGLRGKVYGRVVDASSPQSVKDFASGLEEIDHLVWTSGALPNDVNPNELFGGSFKDQDLEKYKGIFDIRLWGLAHAVQIIKIRDGGSITLTGGASYAKPIKGLTTLIPAIGAVDAFTRGLAIELAPVRVNCVFPGLVNTEFFSDFPEPTKEAIFKAEGSKLPVGHVGTPEELAEAYLFLMKCTFITGQRIVVDGGSVII